MSYALLTAPAAAERITALEREIVALKEQLRVALNVTAAPDDGLRAVAAQLAAALTLFGDHDRVALSHGSKDKCSCCFEQYPCDARRALDAYAKAKVTP